MHETLLAASSGVGLTSRGTKYFVAPGTGSFLTRGRTVNPADTNSGLTPLVPFATINKAFNVLAEGDSIILLKEGVYTLTANISSTLNNIKMIAYPGISPLQTEIDGVAGGSPLTLRGMNNYLKGFEIDSVDPLYPSLVIKGRYTMLEDLSLTGSGNAGLSLKPEAAHSGSNKRDASFIMIRRCRIEYVPIGILFDGTTGDFAGPTDCRIEDCWFNQCTTRAIGQTAGAGFWLDGNISIVRNYFADLSGATEFIKLDNAGNGGSVKNLIAGNYYGHAGITGTQVALTAGGFFHIGNYDKAGLITGV